MKKILIADSDETLKDAFRLVFPKDQYEILYSPTGKEALEVASKQKPQILIINLNLPDIKGPELLKALKEQAGLKEGRFYYLKDESVEENFSQHDVHGVINKPINYLTVHQMILEGTPESELLANKQRAKVDELLKELDANELQKRLFDLRGELEGIVKDVTDEAQKKLTDRIELLLRDYIEWYVQQKLPEIAEKILKEKIQKIVNLMKIGERS